MTHIVCIVLCLTPVTAVIVLGWLTRKTARDVEARLTGKSFRRPKLVFGNERSGRWMIGRWPTALLGGLFLNVAVGIRAWVAALLLMAPFEFVWLAGWFAGWENSFNKGYELSGVWPVISVAAVLLSLPVLAIVPMAIAHHAVRGRITCVIEFGMVFRLIRAAGLRYLWLTLLIALGSAGVFGARALPVFAEHFSGRVASGDPEQIHAFSWQFSLLMTALLFMGLLGVRSVMATTYARAQGNIETGQNGSLLVAGLVMLVAMALWLSLVFLVYLSQFLNYNWWSWINQPVLMLPWLGVFR